MRDKSSPADVDGFSWRKVEIGWPVERVPLTVEVVHPRKLTALEWAVLRVVEAFADDVPDVDEVASELGIDDPAFLHDTIRDVVRLRALVARDGSTAAGPLSALGFTPTGRALYRRGQIEAEPAEHGVELFFDAVTDEPLRKPADLKDRSEVTLPGAVGLEARAAVGLDRAREIIRAFHPDLLSGGGEVRAVRPREHGSAAIGWAAVGVELRLSEEGRVSPLCDHLSEAARAALRDRVVDEAIVPRQGVTTSWDPAEAPPRRSGLTYAAWRASTARTVRDGRADEQALELLGGAAREALLHVGWYGQPKVAARVEALVKAGARVAVFGCAETRVVHFQERPRPGLLAFIATDAAMPGALLVDRERGLLVDDVELEVATQRVRVELAGLLTPKACAELRRELIEAAMAILRVSAPPRAAPPVLRAVVDVEARATEALRGDALEVSLARLLLFGRGEDFETCVAWAAASTTGPERVPTLSRIGALARGAVAGLDEEAAYTDAAIAWDALLRQLSTQPELAGLVAQVAPPGASPDPLVRAAIAAMSHGSRGLSETTSRLLALRDAIDARWPAGTCARMEAFVRLRDGILRRDGRHTLSERLTAARQLLDGAGLAAWAHAEVDRISAPGTARDFAAWVAEVEALASAVGLDVAGPAEAHLRRLLAQQPSSVDGLLESAARLVPGSALLALLLPEHGTVHDVRRALGALAAAKVSVETAPVERAVERLLPAAATLPSAAGADGVIAALEALVGEFASLERTARTWSARCADALPSPEKLDGIPWWLSELSLLGRFLGDLRPRIQKRLRPLAASIRSAREADGAEWHAILDAWQRADLMPGDLLDDIAAPRAEDRQTTRREARKGKKKKRKSR